MATQDNSTLVGKQCQLKDNRLLGYNEFGDLNGKPVFLFHGMPGCRFFRHPDNAIAEEIGVRLITIDRPGIGLSDRKPKRTMLDWPADVVELAQFLGIDRFAVAGVSAGGPYAAACAYQIPQYLTTAALISSGAPANAPHAMKGMSWRFRLGFAAAGCGCLPWWALWPALSIVARRAKKHPEKIWERLVNQVPPCDLAALQEPGVKEVYFQTFVETYRQGPRGHIDDSFIVGGPWGFEVQDITIPVQVWHGTDDIFTPPMMGQYLADTIPHTQATFLKGEGHLLMFKVPHWRAILSALAAAG